MLVSYQCLLDLNILAKVAERKSYKIIITLSSTNNYKQVYSGVYSCTQCNTVSCNRKDICNYKLLFFHELLYIFMLSAQSLLNL